MLKLKHGVMAALHIIIPVRYNHLLFLMGSTVLMLMHKVLREELTSILMVLEATEEGCRRHFLLLPDRHYITMWEVPVAGVQLALMDKDGMVGESVLFQLIMAAEVVEERISG